MDYRELPPLAFLPALEAAGRLGSFKAAAQELHLTPSAISQQVRAIEEAQGRSLFERRGHTMVLNADGERYLREIRPALRDLIDASRRMRSGSKRSVLRLNTVSFVAHEFLLPRFAKLHASFPQLELTIETGTRLVDLQLEEVDATLRFGAGPWAGLAAHLFGCVELALVCSPDRAATFKDIRATAEHPILEIRYLQERGIANALTTMGIAVDPERVQVFENYSETILAAEHGLGIALGFFPLTASWVLNQRLAVPLPERFAMPGGIALVHRHRDAERFPFAALAQWLQAEYQALAPLPEGRIVPGARAAKRKRASRSR